MLDTLIEYVGILYSFYLYIFRWYLTRPGIRDRPGPKPQPPQDMLCILPLVQKDRYRQ